MAANSQSAVAELRAALATVPTGMVLVPRQLTGDMAMAMEMADPVQEHPSITEYHQTAWAAAIAKLEESPAHKTAVAPMAEVAP